jgi:two-component system, cell cycle sensor histidine kinase and response regulator CckA
MSGERPGQHPDGDSILLSVFRATPVGITFNFNRVIVNANDSMFELTGYPESEMIGRSARMFYDTDEEYERVGPLLYGPLLEKGRASVETIFRRRDGEMINVVLTSALLVAGRPESGHVVTVQDITGLRRAAETLRESEDRFRGMIEQAPFSVQVLSPDGDIMAVNPAWEKLWGMTREQLGDYNILCDNQIVELGFMPVVERALAGEHVLTPVVRYRAQGAAITGTSPTVQGIFYPVRGASGDLRYVILIHFDLTERVRAEEERARLQEQLQQAMKMEAVGRLAGGIAHDFNNLLTAIAGNAELARLEPGVGAAVAGYLDEILKASESAASLTRQLLSFSRRQVIEPRVLDLNGLVAGTEKMISRLIGEDIELNTELAKDAGPVQIDPGQLEQVLVNLVVNARDAMPAGGRLLIGTARAELDNEFCLRHPGSRPGPHAMLSVSDTGTGMTEEVQKRVFEPFFTTKPQGRGTGLGLATIFGIVKQAGGTIDFSSERDKGTTFRIYLPRPEDIVTDGADRAPVETPRTGTETVLLVEDNDGVLNLALAILRRLGYAVFAAANGSEALETAARHPGRIDLLLTDVVLPGMNGRELAGRLTRLHPETRALYAAGYAENVIVHGGELEKNLHFIAKPYTLESLSRRVRDVLDGEA